MKKILINILLYLVCSQNFSFSQNNVDLTFEDYVKLNDEEQRLIEYKDKPEILKLKIDLLLYINKSRKKFKVQRLMLDILASRVANKMAIEAASNNFMGHFNLNGEKPYHRYANVGGKDHITENAGAISFDTPFNHSFENIKNSMQKLHDAFMAEKAPNDGHKQTCIHPDHNYIGIGIGYHGKELRYYEEYIDRYLEFGEIPETVNNGSDVVINVKPIDKDHYLYAVVGYLDPAPKNMKSGKISRLSSYDDYSKEQFISLPPWEMPEKESTGYYPVKVHFEKPGWYYLQVFLSTKPYKSGKASTDGKICSSGIVIKVK